MSPEQRSPAPSNPTDAGSGTNRWLVLAICCMSLFIVALDISGLNVALPSIRTDLHASSSTLQWILDAYTLVIACLLMLSGSVADRVGRRKVFQIGLVMFGLGSILCAFATSGEFLIAARVIQALGGSMLNPVAMSIITNTFDNPKERAQAIGYWGGTSGLAMALGPLVGGALVEWVNWEAIFWMNVPVVLTALFLSSRYIPESRAARPRAFDPAGQALVVLTLGTLTYAIIEGRSLGWTSATVLTCLAVAALALVTLVIVERRIKQPLIDPRFFRSLPFSGAFVSAILGFAALAGFLFINTLYLQGARGLSPLQAGLMTLPMAVCTGIFAPVSGKLVGQRGPRLPMLLSGVGIAVSAVILTQLSATTNWFGLAVTYVIFGTGYGLLNAPITNTAVSGMPRSQAGVAAGVTSTSRQVGSALGVAVFGTLLFNSLTGNSPSAFAAATHVSWWVMFGCGIGLIIVALVVTSNAAQRSSERVRELMDVEA